VETYRERREILDELMSKESRIKLRTLEVAAAFEQANRGTGAAMSKFLDEYGDWPEAKSHVETIRLQYTDLLWLEAKRRDNKGAYLEYLAWLDMHGLDLHKDDALRAAEFHSDGNVSDCADTARLVASMFPVESGRPTTSIQIEEEGARQISLFRKAQRRAANKSMNLRWLVVDSVEHEAELTAAGKHRAKERYRLSPELFVNDAARQNLVRAIAGDCGAKCTRRTGRFVLTLRLRECESPAVRDPRAGVPPDNIAPLSVYVILRSKSEALRYNRGQYLQLSGKVLSLEPATTFDGPGPVFLEPKLVLQRGQ
ncbi:MAG TPA: hypothetical protein PK095_00890, partial [Myxococcota bacterium]|nr:hypothetical protein [Myxococcota bacterium]